ncbi:RNA methyltransferase RsmE [Facklamia sp. HMSC062C11]|uniref:RsmE family RNA methyltransferase n=1 Tax=Facklamia sp. HMSC062C11 TaxID=1739262 RepID=UPI0008A29668|nr:16S rRNA (uracil(1498)-N(3))-methyltransferase [Facklamia sp. HMSC062C11]OFL65451.1 RNA methyltransferase RsmE [Facklamia sp. HMSC062C11]
MQQYFLELEASSSIPPAFVSLSEGDSHHLLTVLRARTGQEIYVVHQGQRYLARLVGERAGLAQLEVIQRIEVDTELPIQVTIACGLSKNDKLDTIVQKGTECGMASFQPLSLSRDVVRWKDGKSIQKIDRLQKIAQAASQQSKRLVVPQVSSLKTLDQWLPSLDEYDLKLVAYEEEAKQTTSYSLRQALSLGQKGQKMVIVFGSEGGLTQEEVDQLRAKGFITCSLGRRILRAETAPIYALAAISYQFE